MTDAAKKLADENADLKRRIEALEAKSTPALYDAKEAERRDAEWRNQMHQLAEKRMSIATPPSVVRDLTVLDEKLCAGIRGDRHAPTSPGSMIPSSRQAGEVRETGGTGYVDPRPLSPPPGIGWVDAQLIADEVRQRAEMKRKLGE